MHFIAPKYSNDQNYYYVNTSTKFPSAYCILFLWKKVRFRYYFLQNKHGVVYLLSIISFWYDFGVKFCLGKIAPSFFHLPIEWSAAEAPLPWRWEGTPPMEPLPLLIRPCADSNCCSNSRTFFESHPTLMSLWHFLWTSSLHCVHLNPWRPSPQIRSWQYAQKALWNEKEENESITQREKNIGLDAGYTLFLLWQLNPAPQFFSRFAKIVIAEII